MTEASLPSDWPEVTVEEIKAAHPTALATGPFGSSISSKYFQESGVPVIRGSNLSEDVGIRLDLRDLVFLAPEKAAEFKRSTVRKGDLVFTCWGTIGQVGLIEEDFFSEYIISNKQMKLTPDSARVDSEFLYYLFSGPEMSGRIRAQMIGSSVPGFNLTQLRRLPLRLPSLNEQAAISYTLGSLDRKIRANRRMNSTLESLASAIFKSWFVDFDPVREGHPLFPKKFCHSGIPEGWSVVPLPKAFEINPSRNLRRDIPTPYLDMSNLPVDSARAQKWALREFGSGMRFMNGDVLVARITPCLENGKTAFVDFLEERQVGWGSTEYIVLRSKPPLPVEYAYFLARSEGFRAHAIANMTGTSGRQRVPVSCFDSFNVIVPSRDTAQEFGRIATSVMAGIKTHDEESRTLAALRDALLPKLLSGEIRVKQAEKVVGAAV